MVRISGPCAQGILPPFLLERMAESPDPITRRWALKSLAASAAARAFRRALSTQPAMAAIPSPEGKKHRLLYDAKNKETLPGTLVGAEGQKGSKNPGRSKDLAVKEANDYSGATYDFYDQLFSRNSLDDRGMSLISSVHVGRNYANAFWNGEQMAYGDGDGRTFVRFTKALDVVGHELTHGVIAHTANLDYEDEPGALNEHFADVFGLLVKQWRRNETAARADWLVGGDLMVKSATRRALRSFAAPGTAYVNDPDLGTDPQPAHLKNKYKGEDDNGGVHINSGIPNHAFYLAARKIGGRAWEKTGKIWYRALRGLSPRSAEVAAVNSAWSAVGVSR